MRKTTVNICFFIIAAIAAGIAAIVLSVFELLPLLPVLAFIGLAATIAMLLLLFGLSSFANCQCGKKLAVALCRYGRWFIAALIVSLLSSLFLIGLGLLPINIILYLIVLFVSVTSFVLSVLLFAAILTVIATLGCPRCPRPSPCRTDDDAEMNNF